MSPTSGARPVVLVYDPITSVPWDYDAEREALAAAGVDLRVPATDTADEHELSVADVVIVSAPFPTRLLSRLERCVGIICYSVGMDSVDAAAAEAARIPVTNVAGYCTEEVSDHALALLLAVWRGIVPFAVSAAQGDWDVYDSRPFRAIRRLRGRRVGVVGLGRIGSRVAAKAGGFDMEVVAHDPYLTESPVQGVELVTLEELLRSCDAVVLCSALTSSSRGLIDAERLKLMKPDAVLVNVARGGMVDEAALAEALKSGAIGAAALDVRAQEPPPADDPLRSLPNVILTQHVAATSRESHADLHALAAERALELLRRAGRLSQPAAVAG